MVDKESRKWFDFVYNTMRATIEAGEFSPMAYYTSNGKYAKMARADIKQWDSRIVRNMELASRDVPDRQSFIEEKRRVLDESAEELQEELSWFDSLLYFGKDVGDIDIAGTIDIGMFISIPKGLMMKYPLYDWNALRDLSSTSIYEVGVRMTRYNSFSAPLSEKEIRKIQGTLGKAKFLFGEEKRGEELQDILGDKNNLRRYSVYIP